MLASSLAAERLAKRYPQRTLILAGFIITIVGVGVLLAMVTGISTPRAWVFAPGLLLIGLGLGAMLTPSVNIVQSSFAEEQQGEISGLSRSVSNLGSCLGTAIAGTILVAGITSTPERSIRARDDRFGSGRPGRAGGRGIPARSPCLTGRRAATAAEPAPASRDDVSLPPAGSNDTTANTTGPRLRGNRGSADGTAQDAQLHEPGHLIQPSTVAGDYAAISVSYRRLYTSVLPTHLHPPVIEHTRLGAHLLGETEGVSHTIVATALAEALLLAGRIEFFDLRQPDDADATFVRALQAGRLGLLPLPQAGAFHVIGRPGRCPGPARPGGSRPRPR